MEDPCNLYRSQYKKANDILKILEKHKAEIDFQLKSNASSAALHKDLRTVNLEIKISLNEMEHAEFCIQECESKYNTSLS